MTELWTAESFYAEESDKSIIWMDENPLEIKAATLSLLIAKLTIGNSV